MLFISLTVHAGDTTDSLYTACLAQFADEALQNDDRGQMLRDRKCSQSTSDTAHYQACMGAAMGDGRGGSVTSVCSQVVHAKCGTVKFCEDKIPGCSQYGTPDCGADITGFVIDVCKTNPKATGCPGAGTGKIVTGNDKVTPPGTGNNNPPGTDNPNDPASPAPSALPSDAEVNSDIQSCQAALSQASQCCNNPSSCSTSSTPSPMPAPNPGLSQACQQMQQAGYENARANNAAATNCSARTSSCNGACAGLVSKYSSLASSSSLYQNAYSQGQSATRTCQGFGAIVQRLGQQASSSASTSGSSAQCGQSTGAMPSGMPSQSPSSFSQDPSDPYGCQQDPTSTACQGSGTQARLQDQSSGAGFSDRKVDSKPGFNPTPMTATDGGAILPPFGAPTPPGKANVVANNAGGAIPGGGGSKPASLDSPGKGKGTPGSPGYSTDIMQGDRSGGYSQPVQPVLDDGMSGGPGGRQGTGRQLGRGLASVGSTGNGCLPGSGTFPFV